MPSIKLTLEYDGSGLSGWASQPGRRTVEHEVQRALDAVYPKWSRLAVAGRTDAGVHALGQVVSLSVEGGPPIEKAAAALNVELPDDVAVIDGRIVSDEFDARYSARSRTYRYRIWRRAERSPFEHRRSLWLPRLLDEPVLAESASIIVGEHDFRAFTPTGTQHEVFVRKVEAAVWESTADVLEFTITADSFLRHMVRVLVGSMLELEPSVIGDLLDGKPRSEAGPTAPPWGLYLQSVAYS